MTIHCYSMFLQQIGISTAYLDMHRTMLPNRTAELLNNPGQQQLPVTYVEPHPTGTKMSTAKCNRNSQRIKPLSTRNELYIAKKKKWLDRPPIMWCHFTQLIVTF